MHNIFVAMWCLHQFCLVIQSFKLINGFNFFVFSLGSTKKIEIVPSDVAFFLAVIIHNH